MQATKKEIRQSKAKRKKFEKKLSEEMKKFMDRTNKGRAEEDKYPCFIPKEECHSFWKRECKNKHNDLCEKCSYWYKLGEKK